MPPQAGWGHLSLAAQKANGRDLHPVEDEENASHLEQAPAVKRSQPESQSIEQRRPPQSVPESHPVGYEPM